MATKPHEKARQTDRWAETLFRALSARHAKRWRFVSFRGDGKGESRGIVDLVAIRKNTAAPSDSALKRGDLLEIMLIQVKGGSAALPSADDCRRMRAVARHHRATTVALFRWQKGAFSEFSVLARGDEWVPTTAQALFG